MSDHHGSESVERYKREVLAASDRLRDDGWSVDIEPIYPIAGLGDFRPDFIAQKGDQVIVGEVKFRGERDNSRLEQLAKLVEALPNTTLDLTWLGEPPQIARQSDILAMASESLHVMEVSTPAALLMAWASLEGALQIYDRQAGLNEPLAGHRPAREVLADMASLGDLSPAQFDRLISASKDRNLVAHGNYHKSGVDPTAVRYIVQVAVALARGQFASIEGMVEWFHQFYEDPAHNTPIESRQSGYLYSPGEAHAADSVLAEHFDLVPQEDIDAATEIITAGGITEWVSRHRA